MVELDALLKRGSPHRVIPAKSVVVTVTNEFSSGDVLHDSNFQTMKAMILSNTSLRDWRSVRESVELDAMRVCGSMCFPEDGFRPLGQDPATASMWKHVRA
jgi:hypothetical protein